MNNDVSSNLRFVKASSESSLVSRILDIQKHKESKDSSWDLRRDLKLLAPEQKETRLLKYAKPNKHGKIKYTALSYSWAPSVYEELPQYTWRIKKSTSSHRSNVRDAVLDRVSKFMSHFEIDYLWIDSECINQLDDEEKQHIMGKMHLVYANSSHPLALLSVPIRTRTELDLLARLLSGKLTRAIRRRKRDDEGGEEHVLVSNISPTGAYTILDLIHRILSDDWWSRAWCFQEEFVSMSKMTLLLPTFVDVSRERDPHHFLTFMHGEVAIRARDFRYGVTRFVFAYVATVKRMSNPWTLDRGMCRHVLEKAGWYALMARYGDSLELESEGKAMTTQILADLHGKKYTVPSDLIHISSNCNYYVSSLNTRRLNQENKSLALSMMTLFFMNGEIFRNGPKDGPSWKGAADLNAFEYLRHITFDEFPANGGPGQQAELRKYRFLSPVLTDLGIRTFGHVWQIDQVLHLPSNIWSSASSSQGSEDGVAVDVNADEETGLVLTAIQDNLPGACQILGRHIAEFLKDRFNVYWQDDPPSITDAYCAAAAALAREVRGGQFIGLGHIIDSMPHKDSTFTKLGLFSINKTANKREPIYAFTARQAGSKSDHWYERILKDDKHVSLQVCLEETQIGATTLRLHTKALIRSLCFCEEVEQVPVTFPWPRSLVEK